MKLFFSILLIVIQPLQQFKFNNSLQILGKELFLGPINRTCFFLLLKFGKDPDSYMLLSDPDPYKIIRIRDTDIPVLFWEILYCTTVTKTFQFPAKKWNRKRENSTNALMVEQRLYRVHCGGSDTINTVTLAWLPLTVYVELLQHVDKVQ